MPFDLASSQEIAALDAKLSQVLALLVQPAAPTVEPLVTLEQVAGHTKFDKRTVRDWVKTGRFDATGHRVYLPAYEYREGQLRFKLSEVEAFGIGIGVLTPNPILGQPALPTKKAAAPARTKKNAAPVDSRKALKVA
jgi:hypothetical protein